MPENSKHKILIVDDNPKNIQLAAGILTQLDAHIGFATSGEEALKRLDEGKYDLVLMDVMMPEMDGFEASRRIKEQKKNEKIPIIFVTAKSDDADVLSGFYSGGVDYVGKPYKSEELLARVKVHLNLKRYQDTLEQMVEDEIAKRLEQQELMIRQSRMAAMGEMLGIIAHQWTQPLTIAQMCLDNIFLLIEEKCDNIEEYQEHSELAAQSVKFMTQTIKDFKSYFSPNKTKVRFNTVEEIDFVLKMLKPKLERHDIEILLSVDRALTLFGSASEFKQVILNIISNAIDVIDTKAYRGIIKIDVFEAEGKVIIQVADNGGGIAEETLPKIFDDYFTTKGEKGTGIGLAMSKMIVEESFAGKIVAKNSENGAIFRIEIENLA